MKIFLTIFGFLTTCSAQLALANDCRFDYWQVIPLESECKELHLPSFDFRAVPHSADAGDAAKRFCNRYEIRSKGGLQYAMDCYMGEGDRTGAEFRVEGKMYIADVSFQGCVNGKEARGIMFVPDGWSHELTEGWSTGPNKIYRFWPVASLPKRLACPR